MLGMRRLTPIDNIIAQFDQGLRTVFSDQFHPKRPSPACYIDQEGDLSDQERDQAARLLRIDDTGEVCAQALYQGQALTTRSARLKATLQEAADEENDHLAWCQDRLKNLGAHRSYLNPIWYTGSFCMGAVAGFLGDKWSLGFLAETEQQVVRHLDDHLQRLPRADRKSHCVLTQMREDELKHASTAQTHGGAPLPSVIKKTMRCLSKVMTTVAYWI